MTATKKLYRVLIETSTPQNAARGQRSLEVLYCGYDRDEARRTYHENTPGDFRRGYADYYRTTKYQSMACDE